MKCVGKENSGNLEVVFWVPEMPRKQRLGMGVVSHGCLGRV